MSMIWLNFIFLIESFHGVGPLVYLGPLEYLGATNKVSDLIRGFPIKVSLHTDIGFAGRRSLEPVQRSHLGSRGFCRSWPLKRSLRREVSPGLGHLRIFAEVGVGELGRGSSGDAPFALHGRHDLVSVHCQVNLLVFRGG